MSRLYADTKFLSHPMSGRRPQTNLKFRLLESLQVQVRSLSFAYWRNFVVLVNSRPSRLPIVDPHIPNEVFYFVNMQMVWVDHLVQSKRSTELFSGMGTKSQTIFIFIFFQSTLAWETVLPIEVKLLVDTSILIQLHHIKTNPIHAILVQMHFQNFLWLRTHMAWAKLRIEETLRKN